jgi:hypothetical protein
VSGQFQVLAVDSRGFVGRTFRLPHPSPDRGLRLSVGLERGGGGVHSYALLKALVPTEG